MNREIKNCPGWRLSDEHGHLKAYSSSNDTQIFVERDRHITVSLRSPVHTVDIPIAVPVVRALLAQEKRKK